MAGHGVQVDALRSELFEARQKFEMYRREAEYSVRDGDLERAGCLAQLANACAVLVSGLVQQLVALEGLDA